MSEWQAQGYSLPLRKVRYTCVGKSDFPVGHSPRTLQAY